MAPAASDPSSPASLGDPRLPGAAALLVAAVLVASPLVLYPHAGQTAYDHSVEPIDRSEVPEEVVVRDYADLSPEAQAAVDAALADPDGSATVYGEANKPPEFFYSDYADYGRGIYVIEKDGGLYRLTTAAAGGIFPRNVFETAALVLTGAAVGLAGAVGWRQERRRVPAGFAVGGLAALGLVVAPFPAGSPLGVLDSIGGLLFVPVAWGAVGATHDVRTALGAAAALAAGVGALALATTTGGLTLIAVVTAVFVGVAAALGAAGRRAWAAL